MTPPRREPRLTRKEISRPLAEAASDPARLAEGASEPRRRECADRRKR